MRGIAQLNFAEAKPVHNHSMHTGQEWKIAILCEFDTPLGPSAAADPGLTTGSLELKGVRRISQKGWESGSNSSMLAVVASKERK